MLRGLLQYSVPKFSVRGFTMVQPVSKKPCLRMGTHSGTFHTDEALACFMLRQLPAYKDAILVRSRDPAALAECDIVVDVGGVYDPTTHRYDHHQRGFAETMSTVTNGKMNFETKLSSAGLVYHHFGREVLNQLIPDVTEENRAVIYRRLYEYFFEEVDAVDNGINATEEKPRYHVTTTLSGRVRALNPNWNDKEQDFDGQFQKAMNLVGKELTDRIESMARVWLPALELVKQSFEDRFNVHPSGKIVRLANEGCPWKEHLYNLEEAAGCEGSVLYVLCRAPDSCRVMAVGVRGEGFTNRLSLPEKWMGVRDEALSEISGIPECVFVHANGFIGANKTMEGALAMAVKSLQMQGHA